MDIGPIAPYFVARHGFSPRARVIAFSGDNPNSLAALRLERPGDVAVSLGTSDTIFGALARPIPSAVEGHIFGNPIEPRGFMALLCFQNGSRTREAAREAFAGGAWARFNRALRSTPPGNGGRLGFFFTDPEITPPIQAPGSYWFDADDRPVPAFPNAAAVRAVVEGQFLSLRRHSGALGLVPRKLLATGGASVNPYLLQILADVFGVPVHVGSVPASAALGAALRALHGWRCAQARAFIPFARAVRPATGVAKACDPIPAHHRIYDALQPRAARLERRLAGNG